MKKVLFTALFALAAAAVLGARGFAQTAAPIVIGVVYSFTGADPSGGQEFDGAVAAWQKEHGTTVAGRKIVIVRRDDGGPQPDVAKRAAQELIVQEKADFLLGAAFTPVAIALKDVSTAAKKPFFVVNASTSNILKDGPYSSRFSFTMGQTTPVLARWALKNGVKSVYTMYADFGPGIEASNAFSDAFSAGGGKVLGRIGIPFSNTDFAAYMQRAKDAKPDAIFVFEISSTVGKEVIAAYRNGGLDKAGIRLLTSGLVNEDQLDSVGDESLGVISAFVYTGTHPSPLNQQFIKDFHEFQPKMSPNFIAVSAYDAMHAIYAVIDQQHGNVDPDATMDLVKKLSFESPRGPVAIDPATRDLIGNVYITRTERVNGHIVNREIETTPMVRDPLEH